MFLRFITQFINEEGNIETGIFNAADFLRDHNLTQDNDVAELKYLIGWFGSYLNKPNRLSNANSKKTADVSLSWFKDSAKRHIKKIHEIKKILEKYQLVVEMITSKNPGYIVYEDEYQVSAVPFKSNRNKVL